MFHKVYKLKKRGFGYFKLNPFPKMLNNLLI